MSCQKWPTFFMNLEQEREFLQNGSDLQVCGYLATNIRRIRRQSKESQDVFARKVGVPLRTYKRFEANGKASLETFIQILRAIERTQYLFMLFPQPLAAVVKPTLDERLRQLTPTKFK